MLIRTAAGGLQPAPLAVQSVLVFRALKLGDMLCAVPALRALRAALPGARICLVGLPWAAHFAARYSRYIDEFFPFPGHPGLPEQHGDPFRFRKFRREMRTRNFGLAIQMHGSGRVSNEIVMSLGCRITAGFHPLGEKPPDPDWFAPYREDLSEVERNLALLSALGMPSQGSDLEFPILDDDGRELVRSGLAGKVRPGAYACIHPGASSPDKRWPVERFAAIARALRQRGLQIVVTGNAGEAGLAAHINNSLDGGCIDAASLDLGLGALGLLFRNSSLLVCNDTGVSHLAAALHVPSIVIFSQADPIRWAPADQSLHRSLGGAGSTVSIEEVLRAVEGFPAAKRRVRPV